MSTQSPHYQKLLSLDNNTSDFLTQITKSKISSKTSNKNKHLSRHSKKLLLKRKLTHLLILFLSLSLFISIIYILSTSTNIFKSKSSLYISSILLSEIDKEFFISFLPDHLNDTIKLVFKSSYDGDNYKTLLQKTSEYKSLFFIIKDTKGRRFGFNVENGLIEGKNKLDFSSSVFSMDTASKYYIVVDEFHINDDYFIKVGTAFVIPNNFLSKRNNNQCTVNIPLTYAEERSQAPRKELSVYISELEVFTFKKNK